MRLLNNDGRLALEVQGRVLDVARASDGRFDADPQAVYARWDEFRGWAASGPTTGPEGPLEELDEARLGPPVPLPPQVFAVGLNYREHATEAGLDLPEEPFVFTKFPASVTGPFAEIELPSDTVDIEAELVADILHRLRGCTTPSDLARRVGGHQVEQNKCDQADAEQNQQALGQASGDIGTHQ